MAPLRRNLSLERTRLEQVLSYDSTTGLFRWRSTKGRATAGHVAGTVNMTGYRTVMIDGVVYKCGRLAWLYVTGKWPDDEIDHINRDRADDRFANLREASRSQNQANTNVYRNNKAGLRGVNMSGGRWRARIYDNDHLRHIGYFSTEADARAAYLSEAARLHGEFAS